MLHAPPPSSTSHLYLLGQFLQTNHAADNKFSSSGLNIQKFPAGLAFKSFAPKLFPPSYSKN